MQLSEPERKSFTKSEHVFHSLKDRKIIINNGESISVLTQSPTTMVPQVTVNGVKRPITIMDLGKLLLLASRDGQLTKVRDLIHRGAPFTTDWLGTSPLHLAAKNNHYQTCVLLLRSSISKDVKNKVNRTPLHVAAYEGHDKIVELLLSVKAEVDPRDMLKMTPLHWAVEREFTNVVQILLSYGADPHAISKFQKTPYSLAQNLNNVEILKLLSMATQLHESNLKQTELAAASLVSEMKRFSKTKTSDPDPDTYEHMLLDQKSDSNSCHLPDADDDGVSLSEAIVQLQGDGSKPLDTYAMKLLQDHGISMLPQDELENSMLTSALKSGRTLRLSEAGKLGLSDLKMKIPNTPQNQHSLTSISRQVKRKPQYLPYPSPSASPLTTSANITNSSSTTSQPQKHVLLQKSSNSIKFLSADDVKQLYTSGDKRHIKIHELNANTTDAKKIMVPKSRNTIEIQKLLANSAIKIESFKGDHHDKTTQNNFFHTKNTASHRLTAGVLNKLPNFQDTTVMLTKDRNKSLPPIEISAHQQIAPTTFNTAFVQSTSNASNASSNNKQSTTQHKTTLNMLEIEKQLIELRKQTEDLRKQLEMTQQQNEDYRIRLERVEKELDGYRNDDVLMNNLPN